ncbi:hypothetical protein SAMN05421676_105133 [Salinibacillus kushneri]|uniref:Uncharacterized protein n=1 Tax=Salinibacillus kushneri TaxID=237682 RepID=A0A1I0EZ28_9BACI|nr:hypothetical protein [Salinibacillus kushneri]SET50748.1 hypothetical protein SAMN05421676_105133 [Salinibacillus kushneri]
MSKAFKLLLSVFFVYIFLCTDDWLDFSYANHFIFFLILVAVIIAVTWIAIRLDKWLTAIRFQILIKSLINSLIILFFFYQFFTPYFYSAEYLQKTGLEQIESYYQLASEGLSDQERRKLAESTLSEEMAFSAISLERHPKKSLVDVKLINLRRNYYYYDITVKVKQQVDNQTQTNVYRFTLTKESGDFKMNGFEQLSAKD